MLKQVVFLSLVVLSVFAQAGTIEPIAVTGWEEDVVIGAGESYGSGSTAQMDDAGVDSGATVWYGVGYNTEASTTGLPIGRTQSETTSDLYFQLQDFGSAEGTNDNAVYGGGELILASAARYYRIALIGATGQGQADLTITLNYDTGSPDVYSDFGNTSINHDWFGGSSIAYTADGRVSTVNGDLEYVDSGNPRLYERIFDADETRLLESVTIVDGASGDPLQHNVIMAISGEPVPEPATLGLLGIGGLAMLIRRRLAKRA